MTHYNYYKPILASDQSNDIVRNYIKRNGVSYVYGMDNRNLILDLHLVIALLSPQSSRSLALLKGMEEADLYIATYSSLLADDTAQSCNYHC